METNMVYNTDCMGLLAAMPDECIDLIVTDPPYRVTSHGGMASTSMSGYWVTKKAHSGKIFNHNDIDIADYLPQFYRLLKPDAHCYIMCNNFNLPHFFDVVNKSDFKFVKLLVWNKQSKICGRYYMGQVEHIFFLRKGKEKPINDCSTSDLLTFSNFNRAKDTAGNNLHDTIKPVPLFQRLVENSSQEGGIVLDPFCGSGTLAVACIRARRRYICCEIDKHYYDVATQRIEQEYKQPTLF